LGIIFFNELFLVPYLITIKTFYMIFLSNKFIKSLLLFITAITFLTACNKDVQQFTEPTVAPVTGLALGETIAATPTDNLYYQLIVKAGMLAQINDKTTSFTMFVPDNNGMKIFINAASGGAVPLGAPDAYFSGFIATYIPVASAAGIVSYNTIGTKISASQIPASFPNFQLPTLIILPQPAPANPLVRLTTFPSSKTQLAYVNNIPVIAIDQQAANGVIHHTYTVVVPPTNLLAGLIYNDANLTYFTAAIARGDSGQVGLNKFDSLLRYGVTNMTVLAPNNAAFQTLIYGVAYGAAIAAGANPSQADRAGKQAVNLGPAIFSIPAYYNALPAATIRGIMAYHFLASNKSGGYQPDIRVFSVNFNTIPTFVTTLVNTSVPPAYQPGILVQATFTGPVVSSLKFTGAGTFPPGGAPYSAAAANAVTMDEHAVNGVVHIINQVLLPK